MEHFSIGDGFLEIGKQLTADKQAAEGGAKIFMDISTDAATFESYIEAAITIPIIKSYAEVRLVLNDEGAEFEGEVNLFGGVVNPSVNCAWKWDFSEFTLQIQNLDFIVVTVDELFLDVSITDTPDARRARIQTELYFRAKISVLKIIGIEGEFKLKQDGGRIKASFRVGIPGLAVSGEAFIDLYDITKSDFGGFSVEVNPGEALVAIAEGIANAVNAVAEHIGNFISAGAEFVGETIDAIGKVGVKGA